MKKFLALVLACALTAGLMAGCVGKDDSSSAPESQSSQRQSSEPEVNYNYESLLSDWKNSYEGYWAAEDGNYLNFTFDIEGKAVLAFYDKDGKMTGYALAKTLQASDKSAFMLELEYPEIEEDDFTQRASKRQFLIEKAGGTKEVPFSYIILTSPEQSSEYGKGVSFAKAESRDKLRRAVENAGKLK